MEGLGRCFMDATPTVASCEGLAETFLSQFFQQPQIERATHASAMVVRMHVGRDLDRPTVGLTLPMRRPIRISNALTVLFGDEPLPTGQRLGYSIGEFLDRRNDRFE